MNIMEQHKMPLNTYSAIFKWAKKCDRMEGFKFSDAPVRQRETIFKDIRTNMGIPEQNEFAPHLLNWLPADIPRPVQVHIRPFTYALYSLLSNKNIMTENNLSFPDSRTPLSPYNFPELSQDSDITQLHHGDWWRESWKTLCKKDSNEILVPVIFYMDGISLDVHGRLSLTPLNMTLGILNVEARTLPQAWKTICFHPDNEFQSTVHGKKPTPQESMQNLRRDIAHASIRSCQNSR